MAQFLKETTGGLEALKQTDLATKLNKSNVEVSDDLTEARHSSIIYLPWYTLHSTKYMYYACCKKPYSYFCSSWPGSLLPRCLPPSIPPLSLSLLSHICSLSSALAEINILSSCWVKQCTEPWHQAVR